MADSSPPLFYITLFLCRYMMTQASLAAETKIYISSGGATIPVDVYKSWKPVYQAYRASFADIIMTYDGIGSGEGIKRFLDRTFDFAGSDVALSEAEYGNDTDDVQMFPSMGGPISLSYNIPELPIKCLDLSIVNNPDCLNLTRELIVGIFNGTITRWNDPLLVQYNYALRTVNRAITVVVRSDGSGTTNIFTSFLSAVDAKWNASYSTFSVGCNPDGSPIKWNSSLSLQCGARGRGTSGLILNMKYSIGYLGSSDARDSVLQEARILNSAGFWVAPSIEGTQSAMDAMAYRLGPRLTASLVDAPSAKAYPISGYTYLIVRKKTMENCTTAIEVYRFLRFVLEDSLSQDIVKDFIKAPLSERVYKQILQYVFDKMECRGKKLKDLLDLVISIEDGSYDAWKLPVAVTCGLIGVILLAVSGAYGYLQYQRNKRVLENAFIVHLESPKDLYASRASKASLHSLTSKASVDLVANYKMDAVVVKLGGGELVLQHKLCIHLHPELLLWKSRVFFIQMKDNISHVNVLKFIGVCFRKNAWRLITACPTKGCLQDIIHFRKYQLDSVFRYSIASDIVDGMDFLHNCGIVHGQLTSSCCYVDSRWNAVVGDWEGRQLHTTQTVTFTAFETLHRTASDEENADINLVYEYYRSLLWSAPETIDWSGKGMLVSTMHDTASDVFSCAIIYYEIFTNLQPYESTIGEDSTFQPLNVLVAVREENTRPSILNEAIANYPKVMELLSVMWLPDRADRPSLATVKKTMKQINPNKRSIIDTMMEAVESYAHGLEEKVAERTVELEKLTKSMETLLYNMMPPSVADKLSRGERVEPEYYDSVTLCFSDVVGFTSIASASPPGDVVVLLNDLYTVFDFVLSQHDVYKVETIGDSYMCISGLPRRNGTFHCKEIADMALDMLHAAGLLVIRHMPTHPLKVRLGAHSGAAMAGVVGVSMPRYCIFGDTVNTAARMESSSLPMRIQISQTTKNLLDSTGIYKIIFRGERGVKGKGMMTTYWLIGKEGYEKSLPPFDSADDLALLKLLDDSQVK